ncbi:hypothetical protein KDL01_14770 [Actinospica durhamensis]|uniref:Uncharacterized protein n=1 Tax=Actinospica durhamensis TaxID=1508375 RepID=A0A941ESY1_9ACTN|nr:hypothetical protein [Actinospica durhamensis]MBR7834534.1 hypothetical protein [Actinospica durhamensis]
MVENEIVIGVEASASVLDIQGLTPEAPLKSVCVSLLSVIEGTGGGGGK